ncbi:MAG: efflux RND transporter periplasmic adaptor subunit [Deltaproteobacteria bacterium]|nr:efflux RND transporter periplasmic adaptor subunit [Deltaproteobacteria bacterium]
MEYKQENIKGEMDQIIESLEQMRRFTGPPDEFWPAFLEGSARLSGAILGVLMVNGEDKHSWKTLSVWPVRGHKVMRKSVLKDRMEEIADATSYQGYAWENAGSKGTTDADGVVMGVRLDLEEEGHVGVAVFFLENNAGSLLEEVITRLKLVADIPAVYQMGRVARQAKSDVVQFAEALDLMILLNAEKRYMAAAMTFCNELASRYRCDRVSLGWLKGAYVRLQVISHMERFEKKMDAVQTLEATMEEAFDQDEEILWPRPEGSQFVVRDHEAFSREQGSRYIVSLPVRLDDNPVGVVTCERSNDSFSEEDVRGLRVFCDQSARRLSDLKKSDRWFGARMTTSIKESLSKLLGIEHTFAKLVGLLICVALAFLIFGNLNYRIEATFLLKTDDLVYLPTPFDGYIHEVHVKVGDNVLKSDPLLSLDTSELLLEESTTIANQNRYSREAEKARAQNALADMKIALALEAQARARLKLVRYHINHAQVKAPFSGIVVEGDLNELLGAPVRKGDVLFKVARIEKMYAELKVDERDIHELVEGATGEIALVSRPDQKFPVRVQRIDPVAVTEEEGNIFIIRAFFPEKVVNWWRPGMSGIAKINVGKRNILWIITHRTIDFLRIFFWW